MRYGAKVSFRRAYLTCLRRDVAYITSRSGFVGMEFRRYAARRADPGKAKRTLERGRCARGLSSLGPPPFECRRYVAQSYIYDVHLAGTEP